MIPTNPAATNREIVFRQPSGGSFTHTSSLPTEHSPARAIAFAIRNVPQSPSTRNCSCASFRRTTSSTEGFILLVIISSLSSLRLGRYPTGKFLDVSIPEPKLPVFSSFSLNKGLDRLPEKCFLPEILIA